MQVDVSWLNGVAFESKTGSGHAIIMDGSPEYGGINRGARPMELLLAGLGGCASFDMVTILQKARQEVTEVTCQIRAQRADSIPAVFTHIHLHFVIVGRDVKAKQIEKALTLSAEKYCSASRMLTQGGVEITHGYEVVEKR